MMKQLDTLKYTNDEVIFVKASGETLQMPNLTALVKLYNQTEDEALKERIQDILNHDIASLLIAEIMIDMQNGRVQERLQTGEISKNMNHVGTYNIILESHLTQAETLFEELVAKGELTGSFEEVLFATFPCGLVIERAKFPQYANTEYAIELLK